MLEHGGLPLRVGQGQLNRQPHIRHAQLGDHRAVHQLHHGVDHALGVDHHLDLIRRHAKEVHGLHKLQALVHQGGAVHRDLGAHAPVGMAHRLLRGDILQFLPASAPEGAAGAGKQDLFELSLSPAHQALEDGGMLRVHRHDLRALFPGAGHHQIARADQGLLVGQGDAFFLRDGREGRL